MFNGDGNHYTSNSGNSYNYTYITNNFDHSFNHSNSHNGHGRGGWCGIVALLGLVGVPVLFLWFFFSIVAGWLT